MEALIVDCQELYRKALRDLLVNQLPNVQEVGEASRARDIFTVAAETPQVPLIVANPKVFDLEPDACAEVIGKLFVDSQIVLIDESAATEAWNADGDAMYCRIGRAEKGEKIAARIAAMLKTNRTAAARQAANGTEAGKKNAEQRSNSARPRVARTMAGNNITRRQQEILDMLSDGLANKEIAARLGISEGTVKAHVHTLLRALGATNRTQAVLTYVGLRSQETRLPA